MEPEDADTVDPKKRKKQVGTFLWSFRPVMAVSVHAEPDPDAVFDDTAAVVPEVTPAEPVEAGDEKVEAAVISTLPGASRDRPY